MIKKITDSRFPIVGILGGGQLAQMLAQASVLMGVTTKVLVRKLADVLPGLRENAVEGDWNDPQTALKFSQHVDIVTLENEFINVNSLNAIEKADIPLIPATESIRLIQDKWLQKQTLITAGIPVVACDAVSSVNEINDFAKKHGWPVILKRRHESYDGKGNATIRGPDEILPAVNRLATNDSGLFIEAYCPFERELAVMVCRSVNGETATYPVVDTIQKDHICHVVKAPSSLPGHVADEAKKLALSAVEAIKGLGVMGVEMFLAPNQKLLVNELAPRVHNSGHYTIEGCVCSQFENHIRAILGWPLGSTELIKPAAVMVNLIGSHDGGAFPSGLTQALSIHGTHLHIYGKSKSSKGRKMGHVTAIGDVMPEVELAAKKAASCIQFGNEKK